MQKKLNNELDASDWLHLFDHYKCQGDEKEAVGDAAVVTSSQYDDWPYRGDHPLLKDLSLYLYSMWVYRVEKPARKDPEIMTIPFDDGYTLKNAYVQRIAAEPRVPRVDGCQIFCTDSESERESAYKLLSVLLRPLRLPEGHANSESAPDIYENCYDREADAGTRFEASWKQFSNGLEADADECFRLCVQRGT